MQKLKILIQKSNTLYFTIPPINTNLDKPSASFALNQIDIWSSAKMFIWIASIKQKIKLLQLRNSVYERKDQA